MTRLYPQQRLTPTEARVAQLVGRGLDYKRIARALGVRPSTVAVHVYHIAQKLENPEAVKPFTLVALWAARQRWDVSAA